MNAYALTAMLVVSVAALLAAGSTEQADATSHNTVSITCVSDTSFAFATTGVQLDGNNFPRYSPGSSYTQSSSTGWNYNNDETVTEGQQYTVRTTFQDGQVIDTTFTCGQAAQQPTAPPADTPPAPSKTTITISDFSTEAYSYVILDPTVTLANDQAPTTYRGHCNTVNAVTLVEPDGSSTNKPAVSFVMSWMSNDFVPGPDYLWARSFNAILYPPGSSFACVVHVTNGGATASSPIIIVTLTDPGTGSAPAPSAPASTPSSPAQTSTPSRTGGSSGGGGFTFVPSAPRSSAPAEPEPEPYVPTISNGTITNVKLVSVPLNATIWYGTTQTPLQCDIHTTGNFNITGMEYAGMSYHDILVSNVTHANATDHTPAVYNVTVSTVSTYDLDGMEPFGALLAIRGGGIDWLINNQALATFQDIFGTVDMREVRQYGNVTWAAADGTCRAP